MQQDYYTFNLDYALIYPLHEDFVAKKKAIDREFMRFFAHMKPLDEKRVAIYGGGMSGHIAYAYLENNCRRIVMVDQDPARLKKKFTRVAVLAPDAFYARQEDFDLIFVTSHPRHYADIAPKISASDTKMLSICLMYNNPSYYATRSVEKKRVILSTLPKSGTSWLNSMLKDILLKHKGYRFKADRSMVDMQYEMYFTNHMLGADIVPFVENRENRFIFLYRDPRDHLVSWIHHYKHRRMNIDYSLSRYLATLDFETALVEFITGTPNRRGYGTDGITNTQQTCAIVDHWIELAACHDNIHLVTYEALHRDCQGELRRILAFLHMGVVEKIIERVIRARSFKRMSGGREPGQEDNKNHWRKCIVGDWENYFTPRIKALFKEKAGEFLVRAGYEVNNDW